MADSLATVEQLRALVSDLSHLVSYKWLSRKFSISAKAAKKLLWEFVEKYGNEIEVVYVVSGWTQIEPRSYSVQLVKLAQLEGAKARLEKDPSVHIYSVQASLPTDPAQLWTAEFLQAKEFYNEPADVVNCLRDNRFSGVSCSLVKRDLAGKSLVPGLPPPKKPLLCKNAPAQAPNQSVAAKDPQTTSNVGNLNGRPVTAQNHGTGKPMAGSNGRSKKGGKRSLKANLLLSKSSKQSPEKQPAEKPVPGNADADIIALEKEEKDTSSSDGLTSFRRLRHGGKKRKVVLDDEVSESMEGDEQVISLISQESTVDQSGQNADDKAESKPVSDIRVSGEREAADAKKKRKTIRTRIDERGREVTEVVWESEEVSTKASPKSNETEKSPEDSSKAASPAPPPQAAQSSPPTKEAKASTGKVSTKAVPKAGKGRKAAADPKQPSITSFFKKK